MTTPQALFIGLLQGATELFPVSSLGHAVIVPTLFHWNFDQGDKTFLPFLVLLHLGTATALLILYREDWARIVAGFFRAAFRGRVEGPDERLAILLALGTIPGGAIGKLFIEPLTRNFANARLAAAMLVVNGGILIGAELLRRRSERAREEGRREAAFIPAAGRGGGPPKRISREEQETDFKQMGQISVHAAAIVGLFQAVALVPGISRSGITMAGGLVAGLRHTDAAKFSFLLATPIIFAAGALEVPVLFQQNPPLGGSTLAVYLASAVLAGAAAYLSARFLVRYFRSGRLDPYGVYCVVAGLASLILLR